MATLSSSTPTSRLPVPSNDSPTGSPSWLIQAPLGPILRRRSTSSHLGQYRAAEGFSERGGQRRKRKLIHSLYHKGVSRI